MGIERTSDWVREGGLISVGVKATNEAEVVESLWSNEQLGLIGVEPRVVGIREKERKKKIVAAVAAWIPDLD